MRGVRGATLAFFLCYFLINLIPVRAAEIDKTLYISRGIFYTYDSLTLDYISFHPDTAFSQEPAVIQLNQGDSLDLKIINRDTADHHLTFAPFPGSILLVPGDSLTWSYRFNQPGVFLFYDNRDFPENYYMGLAGMIAVAPPGGDSRFFWTFREFEPAWHTSIIQGGNVDPALYNPDYFTINSRSRPYIDLDPTAKITGAVGDTIYIFLVNTGLAAHSVHFHGFHSTIIYASEDPLMTGRSKDTFPLEQMESMILRLIPDKTGKYPVHDHNLIAVTGANYYPNGMFLTIEIQ